MKKLTPVCSECLSDSVERRQFSEWDAKGQEWKEYDYSYNCLDCDNDDIIYEEAKK